ncbi:MAG: SDR family oxidoreductase [Candidatus Lambdaproteobacteria bacterium]|nr:SDR family oxidoreductase [Candidatus Lambdaproteobacteria bacterium]
MRFKQQTIIVTGSGYGLGKAVALAFAREGGNVVLAARSRDKLAAVADELRALGTRPLVAVTDLARPADVEAMVTQTLATYGGIDVLVNNSGIAGPTALARDITADEWNEVIDVNLNGAFYCCKHCCGPMIEARRGVMINVGSVAGRFGYPRRTPYAASKWGLIGLNHSLAEELGEFGIRVNAVLPGPILGERIKNVIRDRAAAEGRTYEYVEKAFTRMLALKRMPTEEEVAELVLFLASDAARSITGQAYQVDGGQRMQ